MKKIAIIGGTGLQQLAGFVTSTETQIETPYGQAQVWQGTFSDQPVVFLTRHGKGHKLPPHLINYRANIWALQALDVTDIFAVAAVGGIQREMLARHIVIPHQLIDYTWGRAHTFFEENNVQHIDFTEPYSPVLRQYLLTAAQQYDFVTHTHGIYGATQGPRLETAAEIERMARDGCDIVGMTGMPEAALARELGLNYACCAVVANAAAGRGDGEITMPEIEAHLAVGMAYVQQVLQYAVALCASNTINSLIS